jgi:hypothetical protein
MPPPQAEKILKSYFTPEQVSLHNNSTDLWLSFLGHVYDLTSLATDYAGNPLLGPILRAAGTDVSHWFDKQTGDIKSHVNALTGCVAAYTPDGRFLHVPPPIPRADWNACEFEQTPWWLDSKTYRIGI